MIQKSFFNYLIIIIFFLGCVDFDNEDDLETTTTTTGNNDYVSINFGSISQNSIEIEIDTPYDIAGFQFNISGANLIASSGGLAEDSGFTVSVGSDTGIVLGFAFDGSVIPSGSSDILTYLSYTIDSSLTEICITDVVLSDSDGSSIDFVIGDCSVD